MRKHSVGHGGRLDAAWIERQGVLSTLASIICGGVVFTAAQALNIRWYGWLPTGALLGIGIQIFCFSRCTRRAFANGVTWVGLRLDRLQVGDIIGTAHHSSASTTIRAYTGGGPLSHVALHTGAGTIIEVVPPRARSIDAAGYAMTTDVDQIRVLRLKSWEGTKPLDLDLDALLLEARYYSLSLYSFVGALAVRFTWMRAFALQKALICSEFIAETYRKSGVEIVAHARYPATPNDFVTSDRLVDVTSECIRAIVGTELMAFALSRFLRGLWLAPIVGMVASGFEAGAWRLSPIRRAWDRPMSDWSAMDFWSYYAYKRVGLLQERARVRVARLLFIIKPSQWLPSEEVIISGRQHLAQLEEEIRMGKLSLREECELRPFWSRRVRRVEIGYVACMRWRRRRARRYIENLELRLARRNGMRP